MIIKEYLIEEIKELASYLTKNNYEDDAKRLLAIVEELSEEDDKQKLALKRLTMMCNPRYLGNLVINEFNDSYKWWNYLGAIAKHAEELMK